MPMRSLKTNRTVWKLDVDWIAWIVEVASQAAWSIAPRQRPAKAIETVSDVHANSHEYSTVVVTYINTLPRILFIHTHIHMYVSFNDTISQKRILLLSSCFTIKMLGLYTYTYTVRTHIYVYCLQRHKVCNNFLQHWHSQRTYMDIWMHRYENTCERIQQDARILYVPTKATTYLLL